MSDPKDNRPRPSIAPEFSAPGRLAGILKPKSASASSSDVRVEPPPTENDQSWTVFGVGAIWQTAAENAARLDGVDLGDWVSAAVKEAAAKES